MRLTNDCAAARDKRDIADLDIASSSFTIDPDPRIVAARRRYPVELQK